MSNISGIPLFSCFAGAQLPHESKTRFGSDYWTVGCPFTLGGRGPIMSQLFLAGLGGNFQDKCEVSASLIEIWHPEAEKIGVTCVHVPKKAVALEQLVELSADSPEEFDADMLSARSWFILKAKDGPIVDVIRNMIHPRAVSVKEAVQWADDKAFEEQPLGFWARKKAWRIHLEYATKGDAISAHATLSGMFSQMCGFTSRVFHHPADAVFDLPEVYSVSALACYHHTDPFLLAKNLEEVAQTPLLFLTAPPETRTMVAWRSDSPTPRISSLMDVAHYFAAEAGRDAVLAFQETEA